MSCMTLFAQETAMTTTQLTRAAGHEFCISWPDEQRNEYSPLRMRWVVVTDENGKRTLRAVWNASEECSE